MVNVIMIIACVLGSLVIIGGMIFLIKQLKKESDNLNNLSLKAHLSFSDYLKTILLFTLLLLCVIILATVCIIAINLL